MRMASVKAEAMSVLRFFIECRWLVLQVCCMVFSRWLLLVSVLLFGSDLVAQQYTRSHYKQPLANGRFEPRRPNEVTSASVRSPSVYPRAGRYAPTRPEDVRRPSVHRTESRSTYPVYGGSQDSNSSSRFLETAYHVYSNDYELGGFDATQMATFDEQFGESLAKKEVNGRFLGKVVTVPVKIVYKVATKVIGTVAIDWWMPLL